LSDPNTLIGYFNRAEAAVWFLVALGLPLVVKSKSRKQRVGVLAGSCGFVLFGVTDLLEAERTGAIPAWLWASKIICGVFLLSCRILYIGWENFRLKNRWLLFGLFCLSATVALIVLGG
jgi:hypothetical protein